VAISEWIEAWYSPRRSHTSWATCPQPSSKPFTPPQSPRHDQTTETVRESGSGSSAAWALVGVGRDRLGGWGRGVSRSLRADRRRDQIIADGPADVAEKGRLFTECRSGHVSVLITFRYRATAADGIVENELCPVYRATTTDVQVTVDPTEVDAAWWVAWAEFAAQADGTDPLSSWGAQQVEQLSSLGPDPFAWATGDLALLPAAALP